MFGISSNWKETYWGKLADLTGKEGLPGKMAVLGTSFKDIFSLSNLAGSFVMGIIEQTAKAFKEYDQAVIYAALNDIKGYHVVGERGLGWIILKGNKMVKIKNV
jgi:hypothetical protein